MTAEFLIPSVRFQLWSCFASAGAGQHKPTDKSH